MCLKHSFTYVFLSAADQVKGQAGLVFPVYLDTNTFVRRVRIAQTVKTSLRDTGPTEF